ncbi:thiamine phosphate synthase [Thalassobacillus pellis]|uniref:thiamine phosphate synthase n=1 Tax=Thalassobacillus pellis TaxID=748008 RepID=UPI001961CE72|nr:thiamine phosphate synthase [Thalassobacillus pellis]MBM7552040.1 thiamine-phosphate pyrophosphorylase [Thalassobacillus pellis]
MELAARLRKYFIMGSQNCDRNPVELLQEAIEGGITAFQYREKGKGSLQGKQKLELGRKLRKLCHDKDVLFFVNDDVHLIESLEVDGVHVGQDDEHVESLRRRFPGIIIGLSVSNEQEVERSPLHLVDYLGAGPVFSTSTKEDAKKAVGVEWIAHLHRTHPNLPIVGIGGITTDNASSVLTAGASGISVITAITKAEDIQKAVRSL